MITILRTELEDESDLIQKQVRDYYTTIYGQTIKESEYIKDKAIDFCRKQKLKEAMVKSVGLINTCSFDQISSVINDALKAGNENNVGHEYLKDFETRYLLQTRRPIRTEWAIIDGHMQGGLGVGELGVVIAPTGAGKSMCLVRLGAQALKQGKTVIHYTLELSDAVVGLRYDSCISGIKLNELTKFKDNVFEEIKSTPGTLIIKEYPTKSCGVTTLRSHLEKLISRGIEPDLVIVDYGDLLKNTSGYTEKYDALGNTFEELRGLAKQQQVALWTATQTNRSGLNASVVTMEEISDSFSKCFISDFIITLSRTAEDKRKNKGRMFIAKNRFGADGLVYPISMDTSNVFIEVLEADGEIEDKPLSAKEQLDKLKEFKKQLKRNRS
jgi:replicative DNA helicase